MAQQPVAVLVVVQLVVLVAALAAAQLAALAVAQLAVADAVCSTDVAVLVALDAADAAVAN